MISLMERFGVLRLMLAALVLILAALVPFAGEPIEYEGWKAIPTLIAPVIAPIVFMGVLLDLLMARVWITEADAGLRRRLNGITILDLVLVAVLLVSWGSYFRELTGKR